MSSARRVREVYAELRSALGDDLPAGEVLRMAAQIVELADRQILFDMTRGCERPDYWSVDEMIGRRGWMVVEEAYRAGFFDDDEPVGAWRQAEEMMRMAA